MANKGRGRPRASWQSLKEHNSKIWKKRRLEDEAPTPDATVEPQVFKPNPEAVAAYVASVNRECQTFSQRCVPGEILTRQYGSGFDWKDAGEGYQAHGAFFRWNPTLPTDYKTYAVNALKDSNCGPWTRELCTRFLADLENNSHGCHFDVEAMKNVELMITVFSDPEKPIPMLRKFAMEFLCWKTKANEPRFPNELLLDFNQSDIDMIDAAIVAERE